MTKAQTFRLSSRVIDIPIDIINEIEVTFWEDIEQAFPGVQFVRNGRTMVPFVRKDYIRIQPKCIKYCPNEILDVVLSPMICQVENDCVTIEAPSYPSFNSVNFGYTPDNLQTPINSLFNPQTLIHPPTDPSIPVHTLASLQSPIHTLSSPQSPANAPNNHQTPTHVPFHPQTLIHTLYDLQESTLNPADPKKSTKVLVDPQIPIKTLDNSQTPNTNSNSLIPTHPTTNLEVHTHALFSPQTPTKILVDSQTPTLAPLHSHTLSHALSELQASNHTLFDLQSPTEPPIGPQTPTRTPDDSQTPTNTIFDLQTPTNTLFNLKVPIDTPIESYTLDEIVDDLNVGSSLGSFATPAESISGVSIMTEPFADLSSSGSCYISVTKENAARIWSPKTAAHGPTSQSRMASATESLLTLLTSRLTSLSATKSGSEVGTVRVPNPKIIRSNARKGGGIQCIKLDYE
ncbi:hypothetical protein FBU30_008649 [Linnemannia zychae]|nr:hypothetical protein FBU30_008649 [Linnemannia zychae]